MTQSPVPLQSRASTAAPVADDKGAGIEPHQAAELLRNPPRPSQTSRAEPQCIVLEADFQGEVLLSEVLHRRGTHLMPCASCDEHALVPLFCRNGL